MGENPMKKLRIKKEYGIWYYIKLNPTATNDLDGPIYELYNEDQQFVATFGTYSDMRYYIETGIMF